MSKPFVLGGSHGALKALADFCRRKRAKGEVVEPRFEWFEDELHPLRHCPECRGLEVGAGSANDPTNYYQHTFTCHNVEWLDFKFNTRAGPVAPCVEQP